MLTNNRFKIAIGILIVAWASLFVIAGVSLAEGFLRDSDFFRVGPPVNIHGVLITKNTHYWTIAVIVFINSAISSFSFYFVAPVVRRTVLGVKMNPVKHKLGFLIVVFSYDAWWVARTMITLFGYTTQLGFLVAHALGMFMATQTSIALYLYKPTWFRDNPQGKATVVWKKDIGHGHEHD